MPLGPGEAMGWFLEYQGHGFWEFMGAVAVCSAAAPAPFFMQRDRRGLTDSYQDGHRVLAANRWRWAQVWALRANPHLCCAVL